MKLDLNQAWDSCQSHYLAKLYDTLTAHFFISS